MSRGVDDGGSSWGLGVDEESEREAWLTQLDLDALHVSTAKLPRWLFNTKGQLLAVTFILKVWV